MSPYYSYVVGPFRDRGGGGGGGVLREAQLRACDSKRSEYSAGKGEIGYKLHGELAIVFRHACQAHIERNDEMAEEIESPLTEKEDEEAWKQFKDENGRKLNRLLVFEFMLFAVVLVISVLVAVEFSIVVGVALFVLVVTIARAVFFRLEHRLMFWDGTREYRKQYRRRR